jgi:hypothetical protein
MEHWRKLADALGDLFVKHTGKWWKIAAVLVVAIGLVASYYSYRAARIYRVASSFEKQIRYLIENGGTIGEAPASETFSVDYLQAVFGDNPDLLEKLKGIVQAGLADQPALNLGEVAAMIVTYHLTDDGKAEDIVVHAMGGFELARDKPGFHRNGYFFQQLDNNLWNYGNMLVGFLGRDMVLFSSDEAVAKAHREMLDSLFSGDITVLLDNLKRPIYFTAVFPDPRQIVPPQLRSHVQAVVFKGYLGYYKGGWEALVLTPSPKSATYALAILRDMKTASDYALKARWKGVVQQKEWGPVVDPWWAYELVKTSERTTMEKEQNLVRIKTDFERIMVNAVLKSVERLSRDLAQMKGSMTEKLDPREVDARMKTTSPNHYWSEPHKWGPDWPIAPTQAPPAKIQAVIPPLTNDQQAAVATTSP